MPQRGKCNLSIRGEFHVGRLFIIHSLKSITKRMLGAGAWVKLLRAYRGKNGSRGQRLTERVHDIKRVSSYSEVLARMEMWEAALKEHVKDTGCEGADITMANC